VLRPISWHSVSYRSAGWLILLLAVGAFLRIETLTMRPLWIDEIFTLEVVSSAHSLADIWDASRRDGAEHPLGYYGAAYAVWQVSKNEKLLRAPACVFGILSIPLLATLAWRLVGVRAGLLSGLLLALSVYHIEYSQDARSYSLLMFWSLAAFHGLVSFVRSASIGGIIILTLSVLGSLYTHHAAFLVAGAIAIAGLSLVAHRWWESGRFPVRLCAGFGSSLVVVALGFWPQFAHLKILLTGPDLEGLHTLALTRYFFVELFNRWTFGAPWGILSVGLVALGVIRSCKSLERAAVLLPWLVMPFLFFRLVPTGKFFDIRYVITALPPFLILVAYGLDWIIQGTAWTIARLGAVSDISRSTLHRWVEALCVVVLVGSAMGPYLTFRRLKLRCADFFFHPEVLRQEHGFCREHIVFSSLSHRFLLRWNPPSEPHGSATPGADAARHR
jgi:mannosyltransferase